MIVKMILVTMGLVLVIASFMAVVTRKMPSATGSLWALFGLILVVGGLVTGRGEPAALWDYLWLACLILMFVVMALFAGNMRLYVLSEKNRELAMQVSLLNQENEQILKEMETRKSSEVNRTTDGGEKVGE